MLFADDLVLLSSTQSGLQSALYSFADACDTAEIKISMAKTEVLHFLRNADQCSLHVNAATLKQVEKVKYLGVAFMSDEKQDAESDTQIGKARAVIALCGCHETRIVKKKQSSQFSKQFLSPFSLKVMNLG